MAKKKTYYVNYSVSCRYTAEVEARNEEEAEEKAEAMFSEADFGELEYGDSDIDSIEEADF